MPEVEADRLLHLLSNAVNATAMYPAAHPLAREPVRALQDCLAMRLAAPGVRSTTLLAVDQDLVLDGEADRAESLYHDSLRRTLDRCGVERLSFLAGVGSEELEAIIAGLCGRRPLAGSEHVILGRIATDEEAASGAGGDDLDESHVEAVEAGLRRVHAEDPRGFDALDHAVWELLEATARGSRRFLLQGELPLDLRPHIRHAVSVCLHAMTLGRALGIGGPLLHGLAVGALLHDIGLWRLPAALFDEGAPAEPARAAVLLHPELGASRLAAIGGAPEVAVLIAYEHHLRWDGQGGFPEAGARPGLGAQITAVADVWDLAVNAAGPAPRSRRRKRAAEALGRRAGTHLNPRLVATFVEAVR